MLGGEAAIDRPATGGWRKPLSKAHPPRRPHHIAETGHPAGVALFSLRPIKPPSRSGLSFVSTQPLRLADSALQITPSPRYRSDAATEPVLPHAAGGGNA